MFPQLANRRASSGGTSPSYPRGEMALTPIPHPGGPLDQSGTHGTASRTTAVSGSTVVDSHYANTKTSSSGLTTQVSSTSGPSGQCRTPWPRYMNRSKKSDRSQASQSQPDPDPSTQARLEFLGYRQELHRTWDFWALFGLSFCNVSVLPGAFGSVSASYALSGPIMFAAGMPITAIFLACLNAALGEMASAYPVAGAMFTWTFKLARTYPRLRDWARIISWVVGFLLFVSHLIIQMQIGLEFAKVFTTVLTASGVEWSVTRSATLGVVLAFICITGLVSCTTLCRSPLVWKIVGLMTVMLHFAVCIALLITSKKQRSFASLFTSGPSKYASKNKGWNLLYSWARVTYVSGTDTVSHMTEETENVAKTAPQAMFYGTVFTGFMQILCCVCVGMTITPIPHKATGFPIIDAVFAHCPKPVAQFATISIVIISIIANISQFLATSRFFWALARDKALPMSKIWRTVTRDRRPLRATFLMIALSMLFAVFALDPSNVFIGAIGVANVHFIVFAYVTPLILYVFSEEGVYNRDGSNKWTLGHLSKPITCISIAFLTLQFVTQCGPSGWPVTIKTFPFAPFVLVATILISLVFWFLYGRSHYAGPIKSLTTWTVGYEVEIPRPSQNVQVRQEKPDDSDLRRTLEPTPIGSAANMTYQRTEFDLPQAFRTYDSTGSLWSATESQLPTQSFFH